MIIELILFLLTMVFVVIFYLRKKWSYWSKKGVFQVKPLFPLLNHGLIVTIGEHVNIKLKRHAKETNGLSFYGSYIFQNPVLIIKDPDLAKKILATDFNNFVDHGLWLAKIFEKSDHLSDKIWFKNMWFAEGERWKGIRSTFSPIFTPNKIKMMITFMQETCNKNIDSLDNFAGNGQSFELREMFGKFTMDTIVSCAFGLDPQASTHKRSKFVENVQKMLTPNLIDCFKFLLLLLPFDLGVGIFRFLKICVSKREETEFFYNVIRSALKYRKDSNSRRNDLLDMMVDAIKEEKWTGENKQLESDITLKSNSKRAQFDELDVVASAILFMVAGSDTSANTLAFACYQLAKNPEIQEKLRDEINSMYEENPTEDSLTYEDLQKMPYLEQVICETLRFHNLVGSVQRVASNDYRIPGSDLKIDKGMRVWVNIVAIHMDTKYYETPDVFNPEHFNDEAKAKRHRFAYLPFGQGPRGCIGMRFAMMETKLALANIIRKFKLIPSEKTIEPLELDPMAAITYVKNGLYIKVENRN